MSKTLFEECPELGEASTPWAEQTHRGIADQLDEGVKYRGNRTCPDCGGELVEQPNDSDATSILKCASCRGENEYIKPFSGSGPQTADDTRRMNRWRGLRW
jgi:hypothetical protein